MFVSRRINSTTPWRAWVGLLVIVAYLGLAQPVKAEIIVHYGTTIPFNGNTEFRYTYAFFLQPGEMFVPGQTPVDFLGVAGYVPNSAQVAGGYPGWTANETLLGGGLYDVKFSYTGPIVHFGDASGFWHPGLFDIDSTIGTTGPMAYIAQAETDTNSLPSVNADLTTGPAGSNAVTPEPASLTLLGIGFVGMVGYRWRQQQSRHAG